MGHCADCGTRKENGLCPNCFEELYIFETQGVLSEDIDSESEFAEKLRDQVKRDPR